MQIAEIDDRPVTYRVTASYPNGDAAKANCASLGDAIDQAARIDAKNPYGAPARIFEVIPGLGDRLIRRSKVSRR